MTGWRIYRLGITCGVDSHRYAGERKNEGFFSNAKAQAWWSLRDRKVESYDATQSSASVRRLEELRELKSELSQVKLRRARWWTRLPTGTQPR